MGVQKLKPLLRATDTEKEFMKPGLPKEASVAVDDGPVRSNKMAVADQIPWSVYMERMVNPYRRHVQGSAHARYVWVLNDYKTVTRRKLLVQMKRSDDRKERGIEPYPRHFVATRKGLHDPTTGQYYDVVEPHRIAASRHLRESIFELVREILINDVDLPDSAFVFFDFHHDKPVTMLHRGRVIEVPQAADASAEAEARGVVRMMQAINDYPDGMVKCGHLEAVPLTIVMRSVDLDVVPIAAYQLWDLNLPEHVEVSALLDKDSHIDLIKMVDVMKRRGWTKYSFLVACMLLKTDYTDKDDYLWQVGHEVAWGAWDAAAPTITATAREELVEILVATAYVGKIENMGKKKDEPFKFSSQAATRAKAVRLMNTCSDKRLSKNMFFMKDKEVRGLDNVKWLWAYWTACGREVGDAAPPAAAAASDAKTAQQHRAAVDEKKQKKPAAAAAAAAAAAPFRSQFATGAMANHMMPDWMRKVSRERGGGDTYGSAWRPPPAAAASGAPTKDDLDEFLADLL
jgi:hypothetical protein